MNDPLVALLRIVGPAVLSRLKIELPGEVIRIPATRTTAAARRRESVARLLAQGLPVAVIATRVGCSVRHVNRIASRPAHTTTEASNV